MTLVGFLLHLLDYIWRFSLSAMDLSYVDNVKKNIKFLIIFFFVKVWLMIGEVYSKHVNAVIGPITGSSNWMLAWMITYFFGGLQEAIG
jgi:hypothetical protein